MQSVLLPRLLDWLSDTPDPDGGLLAYRRISEALADQRWYLATLRDESAVAKRLMRVLGTSAYVPALLMRAPEVIQSYADGPAGPKLLDVDPDGWPARWSPRQDAAPRPGSGHRGRAHPAPPGTGPGGLGGPARHARRRAGVYRTDLGVGGGAAVRPGGGDPGQPRRCAGARPIAVIGMGRLGGGELGYGSDADVMFVCEPVPGADETRAVKWSVSVAEQVRALLGTPSDDPPLEVDANLRPEGRNGPLVRTLASYAAYYDSGRSPGRCRRCCVRTGRR